MLGLVDVQPSITGGKWRENQRVFFLVWLKAHPELGCFETLQHVANTLQHTMQHVATHTLHHAANTLHHTLQHVATRCNTLQRTVRYCNILQNTAARSRRLRVRNCNTLSKCFLKKTLSLMNVWLWTFSLTNCLFGLGCGGCGLLIIPLVWATMFYEVFGKWHLIVKFTS